MGYERTYEDDDPDGSHVIFVMSRVTAQLCRHVRPTTTQVFQCIHHNIRGVPVKGSNGDSMTKNNLGEHLSWLCISKPSKPPPGPSGPVITDSSTAGFFDDQYSVFAATQEGLPSAGIDIVGTTGNSSPYPKIDRLDSGSRVQLPDTSYTFHEPQSMARLQSGPKSAPKKHLLSQNVPTQLPSPVPTETGSTRRPIRDVYNAQFRTQPLGEPQRIYLNLAACPIADTGDLATPSKLKHTQLESPPPKPGPSPSRSQHRIPAQSTRSLPTSTVDAVDLTGESDVQTSSSGTLEAFGESRSIWREDSASRQEPLRKRGRKRKSEEIESDARNQSPDLRGPTPRKGRTGVRLPSAGFVAIESYSDEAPPPYSTNPEQSQAKKIAASIAEDVLISSSDAELSQKDLAFTEEEYSVTETRTRTETRKRKSMSRAASGSGSNLDVHVTDTPEGATTSQTVTACTQSEARMLKQPHRSQSSHQVSTEAVRPTQSLTSYSQNQRSPKKTRKRFVADSEDDEEEEQNLDSTSDQGFQKNEEFQTSSINMPQYPTLPTVRETAAVVSLGSTQDVGLSKGETEEFRIRPNAVERHAPSKIGAPSPFQRDSPTKMASRSERQEPIVQQSSGSCLDVAQKASVQSFLSIEPSMLQRYLESLNAKRRRNAEAVYNSLLEGSEASSELTEQAAILSRQIQAVNSLVNAREEHDQLSQRKEDLKRKMIAAIEEDADMSAYTNELEQSKSIAQSLTQAKIDISKLLTEAAWNPSGLVSSQSPGRESRSGTHFLAKGPDVVVQSTQIPDHVGGLLPDRDAFSLSSALAQTQYVRQTQVDRGPPATQSKVSVAATRATTYYSPLCSPTKEYTNSQARSKDGMRASTPPPDLTDINTYFSPSKRRLRKPLTPDREQTRPDEPRLTHKLPVARNGLRVERGSRSRGIAVAEHDNQSSYKWGLEYGKENVQDHEPNFNDDEEALYSRTMGSPSRQDEEADDFGQYDDDEDMLEFAETLESRPTLYEPESVSGSRTIFAETPGNELRSQPLKPSTHSSKPAPTSSMLLQHPWSRDVKAAIKERFHLRGFRQNQLEAINATLAGKDAFVLMPTGGGKSLCYQLPSIISSGRTRGVTIVISPLLSLMQDQVDHLQKLKIQAFLINSEVTAEHRRLIMESLRHPNVEQFIQLLYVTPEMISKSQAIVNAFKDLHRRGKFARMVIDEAHCVSQWGHDFRPDYKLLGEVRQQFRGVPAMALTATATENVKVDVIHNLGITGCEIFTQSFNRPNLTYEVRSKGKAKDVLESMAITIKSTYKGQSGIVYCLSRQNCEDIAEKLRTEHGIKAHHYHAGMEPREKTSIQKQWQAGHYHVIVATIAFGMGIDKPDVRFVIHHTIPKSLEGYYQETGRAGRDGKRSGCYLYYGYQDTSALKRMIDDGEGSWEQKERQRKMLRNVVQFCENKSDCRRVQVLLYFNEPFDRENCNGGCDNCNSTSSFESQDFTDYAVSAVKLVKHLERENVTLLHCVDVFRGSKTKKIVDADHTQLPEYGAGADLDRGEIERLFYRLLSEDAIAEHNVVNKAGWPSQYVHVS